MKNKCMYSDNNHYVFIFIYIWIDVDRYMSIYVKCMNYSFHLLLYNKKYYHYHHFYHYHCYIALKLVQSAMFAQNGQDCTDMATIRCYQKERGSMIYINQKI